MKKNDLFIDVNEIEKGELFEILFNSSGPISVWEKGNEFRENYKITSFDKTKFRVVVSPLQIEASLVGKPILFNFKIADLPYFAKGEISFEKDTKLLVLKLSTPLYKAEKRKSYRLLTYNDENALVFINGNPYRLFDLSTSGLGIFLKDESKADLFPLDGKLFNLTIHFHKKTFQIDEATILRCSRVQTAESYIEKMKVGILFNKIPHQMEADLFVLINSALYERRKGTT